jgi:hypothetical protein
MLQTQPPSTQMVPLPQLIVLEFMLTELLLKLIHKMQSTQLRIIPLQPHLQQLTQLEFMLTAPLRLLTQHRTQLLRPSFVLTTVLVQMLVVQLQVH